MTLTAAVKAGCPQDVCVITFDDGYTDNLELGLPVLQCAGVPATVFVVTKDVGGKNIVWREAGDQVPSDLMTWEDLKRLQANGWEIGSHASDHVHLDKRTPEEQRVLIERSWQDIERHLGHPPTSFAYPYGTYNDDTVKALRNLGCQVAVTTARSGTNSFVTDPLLLFRQPARGYAFRHYIKSMSLLWQT